MKENYSLVKDTYHKISLIMYCISCFNILKRPYLMK